MLLKDHLAEYISACFTGLWIQSHEHDDALAEIAQMCRDETWRLAVWDAERGLHLPGQPSGQAGDAGGSDPLAAIRSLNALATPDGSAILVLVNFHRYLNSAEIVQALAQQISVGKGNRTFVVVLSPVVQVSVSGPHVQVASSSHRAVCINFSSVRPTSVGCVLQSDLPWLQAT
jgi:hypothetical protein